MSDLVLPDMAQHLRELVRQVPFGRVTTYRALGEALGGAVAARWVGHFLLHHAHDAACPCHRVIRSDGQLGPYAAGEAGAKAARLAREGIEIRSGTVDLDRVGFDGFVGDRPLERLQRVQEELAARVSLRGSRQVPRLIAGLDISYPDEDRGVGAYALLEYASARLLWSTTCEQRGLFPYISTYLTFRELPVYLRLIEAARAAGRMADVLVVDGSGILHPRSAGIATHLGVVADVPTIGVTKKLLCGQADWERLAPAESCPVLHGDRVTGVAIRPTARGRRPIFVSPGHRVSVAGAERVVRKLLRGRRLPEPLFWADRLSRAASRPAPQQSGSSP